MGAWQTVNVIDGFVGAPDVVRERLQGLGWSETEVIYFGALIKTAAQHRLIDGNAWRGQIKAA